MHRTSRAAAALACLALAATGCSSGQETGQQSGQEAGQHSGPTTSDPTRSSAPPSRAPASTPGPASSSAPGLAPELQHAVDEGPRRATSPRQVVAQVVAAERAIADRRTGRRVLEAAGRLQQVAYRQLAEHPDWDAEVREHLPRDLRRVVRDNVAARRALRSMHPRRSTELADELPAWRIVAPAPRQTLLRAYHDAARRFGVGWTYLAAINLVESAMGRIEGTSVAGAQGPMQFMPSTWAAYGRGDVHDPRDAIMGAARYLAAMGFDDPGGRATALRRYNDHPAYVRAVTLLAGIMARRPSAFRGYYQWQVYYLTSRGSILLPVGYHADHPVPVARWLAHH